MNERGVDAFQSGQYHGLFPRRVVAWVTGLAGVGLSLLGGRKARQGNRESIGLVGVYHAGLRLGFSVGGLGVA